MPHIRTIASGVAALAFLASAAHSQVVIYSNFGPGDSYDLVVGNLVLGPDDLSIGNIDQAMRFSTGAVDTYFTNVELALRLVNGLDFVNIHLMSDAGGLPDAVLLTMSVAGLPGSDMPGIVTAAPGLAYLLSASTQYWIVADAIADTDIAWHRNSIGELGAGGRAGTPPGPWNFNPERETLAFRVNGRLVPTPGAAALGMLVFGATTGRRRRAV